MKVDLRPGDVLLSWKTENFSANAEGEFRFTSDITWLHTNLAPQGNIRLEIIRDGVRLTRVIEPQDWPIDIIPLFDADDMTMYQDGRKHLEDGNWDQGIRLWDNLLSRILIRGDHDAAFWLNINKAQALSKEKRWEEAYLALQNALTEAERTKISEAKTYTFDQIGQFYEKQQKLELACKAYLDALAIKKALSPNSLGVARSYFKLGRPFYFSGELGKAKNYYEKSLEIRKKLTPKSVETASTFMNLGNVLADQGELSLADYNYLQAWLILEEVQPESFWASILFHNRGAIAKQRHDFPVALNFFKKSMELKKKYNSEPFRIAILLHELGTMYRDMGEFDLAEKNLTGALKILRKDKPPTIYLPQCLNNLSNLSKKQGNMGQARKFIEEGLQITAKINPGSLLEGELHHNLGVLLTEMGKFDMAEKEFLFADKIYRKQSRMHEASLFLETAILKEKDGSPTSDVLALLERAITSHEYQMKRLGGRQGIRSHFGSRYLDLYKKTIGYLFEEKNGKEAFHYWERARAQGLLMTLAERTLNFSNRPESLVQKQKALFQKYDEIQATSGEERIDRAQIDNQYTALSEIRNQIEDTLQLIRHQNPDYAFLEYPSPLDLDGVVGSLDEGTVLLSFCVLESKTILFVINSSTDFATYQLSIGKLHLDNTLKKMHRFLLLPNNRTAEQELEKIFINLFRQLILPAWSQIEKAKRVVILPDGPIYRIPFPALIIPADKSFTKQKQYFIESKPIHQVVSATVFDHLRAKRTSKFFPSMGLKVVAFADPTGVTSLPPTYVSLAGAIFPTDRGEALESLPFSRLEVQSLQNIFPENLKIFTGAQASEENAKSVSDVKILHFATHAITDSQFLLNAALVLYPGEGPSMKENGFLQAWEIIEQMKLNGTELVVLSACRSAGERVVGGEGLVGLAQAFQYAGARSIIASLWNVKDSSTAVLMRTFYEYLAQGETKDQAIRKAQIKFINAETSRQGSVRLSHPLAWAGFHLIGDWQ